MLSQKSKRIMGKGNYTKYDFYNAVNGARYIAIYKDRFYNIIDDGTGNGFYNDGEPAELTEKEAKIFLLKNGITDFIEINDNEIDNLFEL